MSRACPFSPISGKSTWREYFSKSFGIEFSLRLRIKGWLVAEYRVFEGMVTFGRFPIGNGLGIVGGLAGFDKFSPCFDGCRDRRAALSLGAINSAVFSVPQAELLNPIKGFVVFGN